MGQTIRYTTTQNLPAWVRPATALGSSFGLGFAATLLTWGALRYRIRFQNPMTHLRRWTLSVASGASFGSLSAVAHLPLLVAPPPRSTKSAVGNGIPGHERWNLFESKLHEVAKSANMAYLNGTCTGFLVKESSMLYFGPTPTTFVRLNIDHDGTVYQAYYQPSITVAQMFTGIATALGKDVAECQIRLNGTQLRNNDRRLVEHVIGPQLQPGLPLTLQLSFS